MLKSFWLFLSSRRRLALSDTVTPEHTHTAGPCDWTIRTLEKERCVAAAIATVVQVAPSVA